MAVESPPIIIKKIKKGGHGHHGGAWKVAFADFVTAMMAFFMLMWLLGSTTPEQKAAIANYMNDPLAESGPGGAGANPVLDGGDGILDGSGPAPFPQFAPTESELVDPGAQVPSEELAAELAAQAETARMEELREELKAAIEASDSLKPFKDQLLLDITSDGLRIQIVDKENRAMFAQGSPVLEDYMRQILRQVAEVINQVPNKIGISGHTDQTPFASNNGYSNWELSADRANAARRELVAGGVPEDKIGRVVGLASSVLFDKENPHGPINRRISIIVMNKAAEAAVSEGEGKVIEEQSEEPAAPPTEAIENPFGPPENPSAPAPAPAPAPAQIEAKPSAAHETPPAASTPAAPGPAALAAPPIPAVPPETATAPKAKKIVKISLGT